MGFYFKTSGKDSEKIAKSEKVFWLNSQTHSFFILKNVTRFDQASDLMNKEWHLDYIDMKAICPVTFPYVVTQETRQGIHIYAMVTLYVQRVVAKIVQIAGLYSVKTCIHRILEEMHMCNLRVSSVSPMCDI